MFFKCSRYDLRNEIPLGIHNLLQAGPHPAAGGHHGLPVEVGEHLHDGVDEGLLSVMRGPIGVPLGHAPYKKIQGIKIGRARRPDIHRQISNIGLKKADWPEIGLKLELEI